MDVMLLADLVATSAQVAATPVPAGQGGGAGRGAERGRAVRDRDRRLVSLRSLRQRRTGVGWRSARATVPPAQQPTLNLTEVDAAFETLSALSGPGSQLARKTQLDALMARATAAEQQWLAGLITGETRQGALDGLMVDAVIRASGLPAADVRRAVMLAGTTPSVAFAALAGGAEAVAAIGLVVGRPIKPMLAASAKSVAEPMTSLGGTVAVEAKLDGIRIPGPPRRCGGAAVHPQPR